jgi:hypothetical protein
MHASTNGAQAGWSGNGSSTTRIPTLDHAPASIYLLGHIERISRELGQADTVLEDLASRVRTLEQRLAALERGDSPAPAVASAQEDIVVAIPPLEPPQLTSGVAPDGLIRLLSRMEALGLEVGRAESELDIVRDEAPLPPISEVGPVDALEPETLDAPPVDVLETVVPTRAPESPTLVPAFIPRIALAFVSSAATPAALERADPSESHALFADVAAPPAIPAFRRVTTAEPSGDSGPPLQIPAAEVFAPDEAYRAYPVRVEADGAELPGPDVVPLRPRRHKGLVVAAAIAIALLATIALATLWTRAGSDDETTATATSQPSSAASVPPASATLAPLVEGSPRVPGVYALIASATAGGGGSLSLVGATRAEADDLLGPATQERPDGTVVYLNGSAVLTFSDDARVVMAEFDFTTPGDELDRDAATLVLARYRPSDAQEIDRETTTPGVERTHYSSPSLRATFGTADTAGRDPATYLEEVHFDPDTNQVQTLVVALGAGE